MESLDVRTRFIELRAKGYSFDRIAGELSLAKKTLVTWSKEYDAEIQAAKALELEALLEKHYLLKEQQIEQFAKLLNAIDETLAGRDLSDVSTEKLLELRLKYQGALKDELPAPAFFTEEDIREEKAIEELLGKLSGNEEK